MMEQATVTTSLSIDVSPDGIKFTIPGLDDDLSRLIEAAKTFTVESLDQLNLDMSIVTIKSDKVISFVERPVVPEDVPETEPGVSGTESYIPGNESDISGT